MIVFLLSHVGYQDSSADIAYVLESQNIDVLTPVKSPDPLQKEDWCFPDTEEGILSAVQQGATHLWANTILFASHPLQTSRLLNEHGDIRIVGQPPQLVEQLDDKNYVNTLLRSKKIFNMPQSWTIEENASFDISSLTYPIVGKPVRGRGSHGVKLCQSPHELADHLRWLFEESPTIILEQYLFGQEGTITIMPPSLEIPRYWAMPIVVRFNHEDGIAPYSGVVAVTSNSRVPSKSETEQDNAFAEIGRECERAAELLHVTAPIRIDVRRYKDEPRSTFAIFDVNMKPVH